jgi:hypothetical protein
VFIQTAVGDIDQQNKFAINGGGFGRRIQSSQRDAKGHGEDPDS